MVAGILELLYVLSGGLVSFGEERHPGFESSCLLDDAEGCSGVPAVDCGLYLMVGGVPGYAGVVGLMNGDAVFGDGVADEQHLLVPCMLAEVGDGAVGREGVVYLPVCGPNGAVGTLV